MHQIKICGTICQIFPPEISKLSCHCRGAGAVLQPPDTFLSELPAASMVGICPLLFLGKFIFENKKSRKTIKRMRCLCLTLWYQYLQYMLCESSRHSCSLKENILQCFQNSEASCQNTVDLGSRMKSAVGLSLMIPNPLHATGQTNIVHPTYYVRSCTNKHPTYT